MDMNMINCFANEVNSTCMMLDNVNDKINKQSTSVHKMYSGSA